MSRKELIRKYRAAGAHVETRQVKLAANTEALERELGRLVRLVNRIDRLRKERKRLLNPQRKPTDKDAADWTPDKYIGSGGGAVEGLDDEVPVL